MRTIARAVRDANLRVLEKMGFRAATLPTSRGAISQRRAPMDIAARYCALDALVCFVADPDTAEARVRNYIGRGDLMGHLTDAERALLESDRKAVHRAHFDDVGWRLENMWPLAWSLGYADAPTISGQMQGPQIRDMLFEWHPGLDAVPGDLVERGQVRSEDDIIALEDLFYCAHNAVRSAQLGSATVPEGFDPVRDGGAIAERRHALTWCVSRDEWDETDLST